MLRAAIGRRALFPLAAASAAGFSSVTALAAGYPSQTIRFIIPYTPGGTFDAYVRAFSPLLQQGLPNKVNVVPINMPGAGGSAAVFQLLQDQPDGYNISMISIPGILMSKKSGKLRLDQVTWLANLGRDTYGLAVGKDSPLRSIADLKALSAKRILRFSSSGSGSTDYFATKVFAAALGLQVRMVVGYSDSPASVLAVARGDVDCVVHSMATLQQMQASGFAKVLFTFQSKSTISGIEDATTIGQPDLGEIYQWRPVGAPPGLPTEVVSTLSAALVKAATTPEAKKWASDLGTTLYPLDQTETMEMIKTQEKLVSKWRSVLS